MKLSILTTEGKDSGDQIELADSIFGIEPNETAIYEDVRRYMANQRQGTSNTKERGQVRGGGRKAYRQKGTGQARRGSIRSPLLKGGGTVFGPSPRDHSFKMSKKTKRLARKSAWSAKAADEAIKVVNDFTFDEPKTRKVADILKSLDIDEQKVLILTADTDKVLYKSARNIPNVELLEANKPTTYQILDADVILIQKSAVEVLQGSIESAEEAVA
ncbi:50S ribosomal protein L4 [Fodinibius sp. AD559]|uniref:50S ribosomal protein L4 n=1 Tax=Fodinibius sp. AD559 TaxID=3424179 RepID=UPI004046F7EC